VADIALFDADALEYAGGQADLVAAMVLGHARPRHVLVHGRFVVQDGDLLRCDRAQVAAQQNAASWRLLRKANYVS
jgi:adenine deaminase